MSFAIGVLKYLRLTIGYMLPKGEVGITASAVVVYKTL
jgi:hypothetical protein